MSSSGAVYVCGGSTTKAGDLSMVLLKYSAKGKLQWVRRFIGGEDAKPGGRMLVMDGRDKVVVVGQMSVDGAQRFFVTKYRADGKRLWRQVYAYGSLASANDVCRTSDGAIYIAGGYEYTDGASRDAMLVKYSAGGTRRWSRTYGHASARYDAFLAVCRRPGGGVYAAGTSTTTGADSDGLLMKYTADGAPTTLERVGDGDGGYQELYDVTLAQDGDVLVGGYSEVIDTDYDMYVGSFTDAGALDWQHTYASGSGGERAEKVVVTSNGDVYAAGYWGRTAVDQQIATIRLTPGGSGAAMSVWPNPPSGETKVADMAAKGTSVWVCGTADNLITGDDQFLVKYTP